MITQLNYHHLQYFWAVAHRGNLTSTASELRVAPSALSAQIRQLESQLGEALFLRDKKRLVLTEAGRLVLDHADVIFTGGRDLLAAVSRGRASEEVLRVGAVGTLSRNFQDSFLRPILEDSEVRLRLASGGLEDLLERLGAHALDLVLSNQIVRSEHATGTPHFRSRHLARQRVSFVSHRERRGFRFPRDASSVSFVVPGPGSTVRAAFDALCEKLDLAVKIRAEVDDMAMLRLLARDIDCVAVVPPVVVRDELESRTLVDLGTVPGVHEDFYAITVERRYQHPLVLALLAQRVKVMLGAQP